MLWSFSDRKKHGVVIVAFHDTYSVVNIYYNARAHPEGGSRGSGMGQTNSQSILGHRHFFHGPPLFTIPGYALVMHQF